MLNFNYSLKVAVFSRYLGYRINIEIQFYPESTLFIQNNWSLAY